MSALLSVTVADQTSSLSPPGTATTAVLITSMVGRIGLSSSLNASDTNHRGVVAGSGFRLSAAKRLRNSGTAPTFTDEEVLRAGRTGFQVR